MDAAVIAAEIARRRSTRHLLLLLDFDGTLAPFNPDPLAVFLDPGTAALIERLAAQSGMTVGVISGRRLPDLRTRVKASGLYLAGFHGLEIEAPGESYLHPAAALAAPLVTAIAAAVSPRLAGLPGVFIEDKAFSIALHYREATPAARVVATSAFVEAARADLDAARLRLLPGASVIELLPVSDWHKGAALDWIRARVTARHGPVITIYVGDDVTDEDAFRAVGSDGIAIAASERPAGAAFRVDGPEGVSRLLHSLDGPTDNRRA
jgi:alpha,alpha-trehalase